MLSKVIRLTNCTKFLSSALKEPSLARATIAHRFYSTEIPPQPPKQDPPASQPAAAAPKTEPIKPGKEPGKGKGLLLHIFAMTHCY